MSRRRHVHRSSQRKRRSGLGFGASSCHPQLHCNVPPPPAAPTMKEPRVGCCRRPDDSRPCFGHALTLLYSLFQVPFFGAWPRPRVFAPERTSSAMSCAQALSLLDLWLEVEDMSPPCAALRVQSDASAGQIGSFPQPPWPTRPVLCK